MLPVLSFLLGYQHPHTAHPWTNLTHYLKRHPNPLVFSQITGQNHTETDYQLTDRPTQKSRGK